MQTRLVHTSMRPSEGSPSSIATIVEEIHELPNGASARAAYNAHELGEFGENDDEPRSEVITLPAGP